MDTTVNKYQADKSIIWFFILMFVLVMQGGRLGNYPVLALIIPIVLYGPKFHIKLGNLERFMLAYILYLLFITLLHIGSNYDIRNSLFILIQYGIAFIGCYFGTQKINIKKVFLCFRNVGVFLSFLGIVEGVLKIPFWSIVLKNQLYFDTNNYRVISVFGHPIVCSCFFLFFWCALLIYPIKKSYQNILANLIVVASILLTRSRSVWLASMLIVLLYILKEKRQRNISLKKNSFLFIIALCVGGIIVSIVLRINIIFKIYYFVKSRWVGMLYAGEGQIIRIETVVNSIKYWFNGNLMKALFGMGKNYDKIFMQMFPIIKWGRIIWQSCIDNQYFTVIHESGIIGLILLISVEVKSVIRFFECDNREVMFCSLIISGFSVSLFFFEGLNYIALVIIFLLCIVISDRFYVQKYQEVQD